MSLGRAWDDLQHAIYHSMHRGIYIGPHADAFVLGQVLGSCVPILLVLGLLWKCASNREAQSQAVVAAVPEASPYSVWGLREAYWRYLKDTFSSPVPVWLMTAAWWLLLLAFLPLFIVPYLVYKCCRSKMETKPPTSKGKAAKAKKVATEPVKAEKIPWPAVAFFFWTLALGIFIAADSHKPEYHPPWMNTIMDLAPMWLVLASFAFGTAVACADWTCLHTEKPAAEGKQEKLGKRGVVAKGDLIKLSKGHTARVMHLTVELVDPPAAAAK